MDTISVGMVLSILNLFYRGTILSSGLFQAAVFLLIAAAPDEQSLRIDQELWIDRFGG